MELYVGTEPKPLARNNEEKSSNENAKRAFIEL